jgi:hypothetical protein
MQGELQEVRNIPSAGRPPLTQGLVSSFSNQYFPSSFTLPVVASSIPLFLPGRFDVMKVERSTTSSNTTSVTTNDTAENIRNIILAYGVDRLSLGHSKRGDITAPEIKEYLKQLGISYGLTTPKPKLLELLLNRLGLDDLYQKIVAKSKK